jgi:hypothetical protein
MAILSDDVDLLQGFFRTWLLRAERRGIPVHQGRTVRPESTDRGGSLKPIERLLVLEQNPLLTGLRVDHFLTVASLAEEVSAEAHTTLFEASDRPDVYFLLEGTLRLEGPQGQSCDAVAGDTIAILAALAGLPVEWRATVVDDIRALRVGREEMVQLLADDVELLRGLTSRVLGEERDRRTTDVRGALLQSVG